MYQQLVVNEYGEPMYVENVMDYEEEQEAYWEEMQMRADDPMYAAYREKEEWIDRATAVFEANGLNVPYYVKEAWADEMRKLQRKNEEEKIMRNVRPLVAFLNKCMPDSKWYANYYNETPDECAHAEIDCYYENRPYVDDFERAIEEWEEINKDNDDLRYATEYIVRSKRYMKVREQQN